MDDVFDSWQNQIYELAAKIKELVEENINLLAVTVATRITQEEPTDDLMQQIKTATEDIVTNSYKIMREHQNTVTPNGLYEIVEKMDEEDSW